MTPELKRKRIGQLIWVYIYGGLLAMVLGIATARTNGALGWWIGVPGAVVAAVGVLLIYVRSRMSNDGGQR